MRAFAVNAGEGGEFAAASDGALMATSGAGLSLAEASVRGVCVVLRAQRAFGVFLFADGMIVSEGEAVFAVCCSRSSVEYRDTICSGEESYRMAQNIGMLRGESDDNRRCCFP